MDNLTVYNLELESPQISPASFDENSLKFHTVPRSAPADKTPRYAPQVVGVSLRPRTGLSRLLANGSLQAPAAAAALVIALRLFTAL